MAGLELQSESYKGMNQLTTFVKARPWDDHGRGRGFFHDRRPGVKYLCSQSGRSIDRWRMIQTCRRVMRIAPRGGSAIPRYWWQTCPYYPMHSSSLTNHDFEPSPVLVRLPDIIKKHLVRADSQGKLRGSYWKNRGILTPRS